MNILLVDDDILSRRSLANFLVNFLGHKVTECSGARDALKVLETEYYPMLLTDIMMPEMNGIELLKAVKEDDRLRMMDVVIITGYGKMSSAIEALRAGAYDYLLKPINVDELAIVVEKIANHQSLLQENIELKTNFDQKLYQTTKEIQDRLENLQSVYAEIVGVGQVGIFSEAMKNITNLAGKFHKDRSIPVLIQGETGTGKEIVARMIHYGKGDTTSPFICINCSAISPTLFESELFGYEGGSYTGSKQKGMPGKLELAQGGTIFLDEIGDMPIDMQPKLLRVLQEKEMYRIGGINKIRLDLRFICATNQDLNKLIEQGRFRRDLLFRINTGFINIPSLREQKEAIIPLAQMFLAHYAEQKKKRFRYISKEAIDILENRTWEGNIRDLQHTIEVAVLIHDDIELKPRHLSHQHNGDEMGDEEGDGVFLNLDVDTYPLKEMETRIIRAVVKKFDNNKSKAAEYLDISRYTLRNKLGETK